MSYFYEIALSLVPGIGPIKAKNLIRYCGSAEAVFTEKRSRLIRIPEIGDHIIQSLGSKGVFEKAEKELLFVESNNVQLHYYQEENFPRRLLHCPDHPLILYSKGNINFNSQCVLSIVGTRSATPYGKDITQELVSKLKGLPLLIVSGLAYGIDVAAHRAALKNGIPTVGVVGHGLDQIYPRSHSRTADQMQESGGLVSEFVSGTGPDRENFPKRNRIVAGLSDVTLVVESKDSGGSLITGRLAADYNRDVFAVPGRVGDPFSVGCNHLIERNLASIYAGPEEFIADMGWLKYKNAASEDSTQMEMPVDLDETESEIVDLLRTHKKLRKDEIASLAQLSMGQLAGTLLSLELRGILRSAPGGNFFLATR